MFPCNRPPAFAHLTPLVTAALRKEKPPGSASNSVRRVERKASVPVPAPKMSRPAERTPAASAPSDFSHLRRAAMKRGEFARRVEDTERNGADQTRRTPTEVRADKFAATMESVKANIEGRAPRNLVDVAPKQEAHEFDADEMIAVLRRRDAARAARRPDLVG